MVRPTVFYLLVGVSLRLQILENQGNENSPSRHAQFVLKSFEVKGYWMSNGGCWTPARII